MSLSDPRHAHAPEATPGVRPEEGQDPRHARLQRRAMAASVAISFLMLAGKLAAYFLTGSTAILSDALESVVHLAATSVAGFSLWYAAQPPDERHPYGHGKIAYFSSGLEGVLILVAALGIVWTAVRALVLGPELEQLGTGLAIIAALTLVNLVLGLTLVHIGRRTNALVLVANGHHVLTDMWTSLGVLAGVALVWATGVLWLDPAVALLAGLNILWTSTRLIRSSYEGLMETTSAEDTARVVAVLADAERDGLVEGAHHVRHRRVNDRVFLEMHLLMPDALRLDEAHRRATAVETRLRDLFPDSRVQVTSHLEPASHDHPPEAPHDAVTDGVRIH
ncbi:MAG: cation diffusion facilitator family transporter [Rubricoccaceae bacterium]